MSEYILPIIYLQLTYLLHESSLHHLYKNIKPINSKTSVK